MPETYGVGYPVLALAISGHYIVLALLGACRTVSFPSSADRRTFDTLARQVTQHSGRPPIMDRVATVVHPHVEPWEFDALQFNAGWSMDIELIAGEAVVVSPEGGASSAARGELYVALRRWQEDTGDEGLFLQDVFVAFPDGSRPAPDISWWSAERRSPVSSGAMESVPDLVVEVLSPSTRANDEGIKRELYMGSGVRELWLVDPDAHTITRVSPDAADVVLSDGESLRSELLPGFALDLAGVFRH